MAAAYDSPTNDAPVKQSTEDKSPLLEAAKVGDHARVRVLLDEGVDINIVDLHNQTALLFASSRGHARVVDVLLERGANIDLASTRNWTPLHLACQMNQFAIAEKLIRHGADFTVRTLPDNRLALDICGTSMAAKLQEVIATLECGLK